MSITAINTTPYVMDIETSDGVKRHPFHLGTDKRVALTFVMDKLRIPGTKSVALYRPGMAAKEIYDWRDLPENDVVMA